MSEGLQEAIVYAIVSASAIAVVLRFAWPRRRGASCSKCTSADRRPARDRRVHLTVLP